MVANVRCDRPEESLHIPTVGSRVMARTVRLVIGALLVLVGAVWILQGVGLLQGSFMTGEAVWAVIGAISAVIGLVLLRGSRRVQ
jgi:hypothetical protein